MPWAVMQEWSMGGHDTSGYDAVNLQLGAIENPPAGLIVHTAGGTEDGGFRVFDVWETREAWEAFERDRLGPAIEAAVAALPADVRETMGPPDQTMYELHGFMRP